MRNPTPPSSGCAAAQRAAPTTLGTVRKATRPTRVTLAAAGVLSMKRTPADEQLRVSQYLWQLLAQKSDRRLYLVTLIKRKDAKSRDQK